MKPNVKRYVISLGVGAAIAALVMVLRKIYSVTELRAVLVILNDAFFISGMCLVCIGGLIFVSNHGMFSMFGYGISSVFTARQRNINERKYKDFYEYKEARKDKKHNVSSVLVSGLIFLVLSFIVFAIYTNLYM